MNKLFALLVLFLSPVLLYAQKSVAFMDGTIIDELTDTKPTCNIEETDTSVIVTYDFTKLNLLPDPLYPSAVMPRINGFGNEHTPGKPEVLMRWDAISLPLNCTGQISVIDSAFIDIPVELSPARKIRICGDEDYTTSNVPPIASYKGFSPSFVIPSFEQHNYQGTPVLNVCVCPIKYNNETKTTRIYSMIKYKVTWKNKLPIKTPSFEKRNSSAKFLNNVTLNSIKTQNERNQNSLTTEDYLIISTTEYQSAVERFAEWKRMLGFKVGVLYQNGWSTTNIRSYIQQYDSTHSNLCYVLFVGDLSDISSFDIYNTTYGHYISDYHYSCIDNDNFSDIYQGRLLVSSPEEAETLVGKIINYERNPVISYNFYDTGINGAVFEANGSGYERTRAVLTSELIKKVVSDSLQKSINFVYLRGGGAYPAHWNNSSFSYGNELPESILQGITWNGNAKKMMNYINNGSFYTFYIGHGEWDKWYSLNLNKDSLDRLNNGIKYPVVFSMSCLTGDFIHNDCFAQHFCSLENNGCVAIFAATCNAPFGSTEILGMDMFDAIWPGSSYFNPIYPNGNNGNVSTPSSTYRLGQILNQGMYKMRMTWNYDDLYTCQIFHCFGDPSMRIYTQQPTAFDNATITRSNGTISVNAGENNAEISFYNKTTGEVKRYSTLQATYNCGTNDVSVCISGPNKIPYVDPLFLQNEVINGPVEYNGGTIKAGYSVTDQRSFGDVYFNSGEITIKGNSVEFHSGTNVELGTELKVETIPTY